MRAFALVLAGKRALADDIVMRTVVAAWANIDAFPPGSNMRVWLFQMLRTIHHADPRPSDPDAANGDGAVVDLSAVDAASDDARTNARFRQAFNALPCQQREALILTGPECLSLRDAAVVCDCTPAAIGRRVKLGRRKLAMIALQPAGGTRALEDPAVLEAIFRRALSGGLRTHVKIGRRRVNRTPPADRPLPPRRTSRLGIPR
ncbi:sigma factor-like helix-turn-helix DNA-binding protein, partial [Roseibacterium sp. SDUM158017]|uniref:sigma factor-like helix-turn-helix DNA-binding protein n=1 Tax=Roseicyclus salinarum TaxID=3036773 RepID=UPI0024156F9C